MKKKALALIAILLTTFLISEAKVVTREEYCDTLFLIISHMDEPQIDYEVERDYGVFDAYFDHCLGD